MTSRATVLIFTAILLAAAMPSVAQIHCSDLVPLTRDAEFPRCTRSELIVAGFPDHMHDHAWHGWQPLQDADGGTYGPGSLCTGRVLSDPDGRLSRATGETRLGRFVVHHNPLYQDCDMVPLLEMLEWAEHQVKDLLGLATDDTLYAINPDNAARFKEMTGMGVWRFFSRDGDRMIIQPYPVLRARTLDRHAAMMMVTDWLLEKNLAQALPVWLHHGLLEYLAEDGVHLANYMAEFRDKGPVLMSPPLIDAILGGDIDTDENRDRENVRRAGYSAFLMVWELIENQGGLDAWNEFLALLLGGIDLDLAATRVYGLDMAALSDMLDASVLGEPYGQPMGTHMPHRQP